ncbi:hypothetical protein GOBAR_DD34651 [Gossypium barbadense]|nr:hypothetical protein GOBAR_DD34651 [Gossypium barbadense]
MKADIPVFAMAKILHSSRKLFLPVGTKLEHIITQLAQEVAERDMVVTGELVVQPSDNHFWFSRPRLVSASFISSSSKIHSKRPSSPGYGYFTFGKVDLVPTVKESLSACQRAGEGRFIGCAQLFLSWFHSHFCKVEKVSYRVFSENYYPLKEFMATTRRDNISEEKWMAIL